MRAGSHCPSENLLLGIFGQTDLLLEGNWESVTKFHTGYVHQVVPEVILRPGNMKSLVMSIFSVLG